MLLNVCLVLSFPDKESDPRTTVTGLENHKYADEMINHDIQAAYNNLTDQKDATTVKYVSLLLYKRL